VDYKILLADDSVTVQKIITLTFSDEGVDVIAVNNGDEAINRLRRLRPALVMADISIPGKTGYEICEFVKTHPEMGDTPVILLVPAFEPFDEERARRIGADHHLTKPFQSIRTLISIVKNLMERQAASEIPVADDGLAEPRKISHNRYNTAELNSKKAKIDELIKRSTQPASENGAENGNTLKVNPPPGNGRHSDSLPITSPSREVEIIEDLNMDNILELDDILADPPSIQTIGQVRRSSAVADRPQSQPPAVALSYDTYSGETYNGETYNGETQELMVIPRSVIDEIVDRVSAQLFERLSGEIARRIAPEVAEVVRRQLSPESAPYRDSENLLDID
jgi:CheY-like chemotaxis protein